MSAEGLVAIVGLGAALVGASFGLVFASRLALAHDKLTEARGRALALAATLSLSVALVGLASMIGAAAVAIVRGLGLGS